MATTHTPGPWNIRPNDLMQTIESNGASIAKPCMNDSVSAIACGANARLIAAAPDLLKALRLLVIACTEEVAPDGYTTLGAPDRASMRDAIAAIEKAGGAA